MTFPLKKYSHELPQDNHPGAFGYVRKFDIHTGVDLYCDEGDYVRAIEDGTVVGIEKFTGEWADSPWWNNTEAILVEGKSGVILYGELLPRETLSVGMPVKEGEFIATVKTVLKKDKGKPMSMLHIELYSSGNRDSVWWKLEEERPEGLQDITPLLLQELDRNR